MRRSIIPLLFLAGCMQSHPTYPSLPVVAPDGSARATYFVELARTPEAWQRGLMRRQALEEGTGMLFLFPGVSERTFWMKDTWIPLDMLFADADGTIRFIAENVPPCVEEPCERIEGGPAQYVLEIRGGESSARGIRVGDRIIVDAIPSRED